MSFEERQVEDKDIGYAFDTIAYVRGTREGYEKIKPQADNFFQGTDNINTVQHAGSGIMSRYLQQRREIMAQYLGKKICLTDEEIVQQQQEWAQALGDNVHLQESGEEVGSTLKAMQGVIWSTTESNRVKKTGEMLRLIEQLENFYNSLAAKDKLDLQAILDASQLEGQIVDIQNGQLIFSRIRSTLDRLNTLVSTNGKYFINMNREIGALGEALTIFCGNISDQEVQSLVQKKYSNGRFFQTGTAQVQSESGKWGTGTADGIFEYTTTVDGKTVTLKEAASIKTTGRIVGKDGKWSPKPDKIPLIQIKSISEQFAVWNMLTEIYGKSIKMQNSTANILVWSNASGKSYQLIQSAIIGGYFERLLAGSGSILSNKLGFDQASCLIVNGTVIPIVDILSYITEIFQGENFNTKQVLQFVNINLKVDNPWKGQKDKKDLTMALQRSKQVMTQIQQTLKLKASLNGNILYQIAKGMPKIS